LPDDKRDVCTGTVKETGVHQLLETSQVLEITNEMMHHRRKDVKDEVIIFQKYSEPYLDCMYEVSAEIINKGYSYET
jgi:hypothetical protein